MSVLVTAFGPFGGRLQNASSLVLQELRKTHPDIRTRIFPVDSVLAPSRLRQAIRLIRPRALLMLGESGQCDRIQLETTAWNEKSFDIPDIKGRQPMGHPIRPDAPTFLNSTLPLIEIHQKLASLGFPSSFSKDPGRYLCNQIFFSALDFVSSNRISIPVGFVHLPLEETQPVAETSGAISAILAQI